MKIYLLVFPLNLHILRLVLIAANIVVSLHQALVLIWISRIYIIEEKKEIKNLYRVKVYENTNL